MKATNKNLLKAIVGRDDKKLLNLLGEEGLLEHLITFKNIDNRHHEAYQRASEHNAVRRFALNTGVSSRGVPKEVEQSYDFDKVLNEFYGNLPYELKVLFIFTRDMQSDKFLKSTILPSKLILKGGLEKLVKLDEKYSVVRYKKQEITSGSEILRHSIPKKETTVPTNKNMLSERVSHLVDPEENPLIMNYLSRMKVKRKNLVNFIESQYKFEALMIQRDIYDWGNDSVFCSSRTLTSNMNSTARIMDRKYRVGLKGYKGRNLTDIFRKDRTTYARKSLQDKDPNELLKMAQRSLKKSDRYFGRIKKALLN